MRSSLLPLIACCTLVAAGCASLAQPACESSGSVRVYQAADINEQWINYVWVEIPNSDEAGSFPGRLFVASAKPMGAVAPSMIDLACELSSSNPVVDYAPAAVDVDMDGAGGLRTSYSWRSCARCSECYMLWNFELELHGQVTEGSLVADVVLNETFHQDPMQIVSLRLPEATKACTQPSLSCRAGGECSRISLEKRH